MSSWHGGFRRFAPADEQPDEPIVRAPPHFSIVVPHYNHVHEVNSALAAIHAQSVQPDEVILVDDGSPAAAFAEIARLVERWPSLDSLDHESNQGVNAACNTELAAATGDFVLFTAADDQLNSLMVEESREPLGSEGILFSDPSEATLDKTGHRVFPLYLGDAGRAFDAPGFQRLLRDSFFFLSVATVWFNIAQLAGSADLTQSCGGTPIILPLMRSACLGAQPTSPVRCPLHGRRAVLFRQGPPRRRAAGSSMAWLDKLNEPGNAKLRTAFVTTALLTQNTVCLRSLRVVMTEPGYLTPRAACPASCCGRAGTACARWCP